MIMDEKTVTGKYIYKGKIINLRLDKVLLQNGKQTDREIVEHPGSVAILPVIEEDKFLLIQQYRKSVEGVLIEIPAGRIEKGEELDECANRELIEETGYETDGFTKLASIYPAPGYCSEVIHLFVARNLKKSKSNPEDDEFIDIVIISEEEALNKIIKGEIQDSKTIIGILLYLRYFR
ncbi:MAG TPA: NUDIX hydrolase [Candidatus Omnitrophica bacterium]|nr:NUDIX hydrolase [Candidatus Omnitrophota bacterium]